MKTIRLIHEALEESPFEPYRKESFNRGKASTGLCSGHDCSRTPVAQRQDSNIDRSRAFCFYHLLKSLYNGKGNTQHIAERICDSLVYKEVGV